MMRMIVACAGIGLALILMGCSAQLGDRGGESGAPPDKIGDVTWVAVFRNADAFPNIAQVCVDGVAFATTSSPRGESAGGAPLVRVVEWDRICVGP